MFCQNCGNQIPDNAKFCGKCGAPMPQTSTADSSAETPQQETIEQTASYTQPSNPQQTYTTASSGTYTPPTGPQQTTPPVHAQQTYTPPPQYVHQGAGKSKKVTPFSAIVIVGGILTVIAYFLPLVSYMGFSVSMLDMTFGTGLMSSSGTAYTLMLVFPVAGALGCVFAFIKQKMSIIAAGLGAAGIIYLFVDSASSFGSMSEFLGIGFYLAIVGVVCMMIGSILILVKKQG